MPSSATRSPVHVVLADGHPLFLDALSRAVHGDPGLTLAATASGASTAIAAIRLHRPQVAVVDAALARAVVAAGPGPARVLVLAAEAEPAGTYAALEAGAAGYLTKDVESPRILRAIVDVARGSAVLDGAALAGVALELRLRRRENRARLSRREHEILVQIAEGRTVARIAAGLHISAATVKTHTLHAYAKLGVSDRAAAVAAAMRQGLLE